MITWKISMIKIAKEFKKKVLKRLKTFHIATPRSSQLVAVSGNTLV